MDNNDKETVDYDTFLSTESISRMPAPVTLTPWFYKDVTDIYKAKYPSAGVKTVVYSLGLPIHLSIINEKYSLRFLIIRCIMKLIQFLGSLFLLLCMTCFVSCEEEEDIIGKPSAEPQSLSFSNTMLSDEFKFRFKSLSGNLEPFNTASYEISDWKGKSLSVLPGEPVEYYGLD